MKIAYNRSDKKRLDKFLHEENPMISRNQIQKFIKSHNVTVNGKKPTVHHWLKDGDVIEMPQLTVDQTAEQKNAQNILIPSVVHTSDGFLIIDKPAGLLTHPTEKREPHTLTSWLAEHYPEIEAVGDDPLRPGIVHRLDKGVGGLILVARDQKAFEYFKGLFHDRKIVKKYYALVHGEMQNEEGEIDTPVERSKSSGKMIAQSATNEGKKAITYYTVKERYIHYTLLDIQILTGRTHQIRTHLYSIGHSIVGDMLYQTKDVRKSHKGTEIIDKPFLFAYHLSFKDRRGEDEQFTLGMPIALNDILSKLKHHE